MLIVLGLVVMKRASAKRALAKSRRIMDAAASSGEAMVGPVEAAGYERLAGLGKRIELGDVADPLPESQRPRITKTASPHFLRTYWREFNVMSVFAIISAINASFAVGFEST